MKRKQAPKRIPTFCRKKIQIALAVLSLEKHFKYHAVFLASAPAGVLHRLVEFGDHVDKSDVEEHPAGKAKDVDIGVELA